MSKIDIISSKDIQKFIKEKENVDLSRFILNNKSINGLDVKDLAQQIAARKKAKTKLPDWYSTEGIVYPPLLSMEQCSSKIAALNKASILSGEVLIDLTGGAGVDTFYLSRVFDKVIYVEQSEELCAIAKHNFTKLGASNIEVITGLSEEYINTYDKKASAIYIDPARRDHHKNKVFKWEDCTPNIVELHQKLLAIADIVLVKASPMLDISSSLSTLSHVSQVHVVSIKNECKEVLYQLENFESAQGSDPLIITKNFIAQDSIQDFQFTYSEEATAQNNWSEVQQYLYEPNASVLKAGAFKSVGEQFAVSKLHQHTHLYTSGSLKIRFPGRIFKVKAVTKLNKKAIIKHVPGKKANITVRNFPADVAAIRKKTGLKPGGETYIFAATDHREQKLIIITEKV